MNWKKEWKILTLMIGGFLACFYLPVGWHRFDNAILESLHLVKWYAQEHVLLCLIPAFFIAGAIAVFVSQGSVMKYLGAKANKVLAYGVAAVSGTILAVCSCTVLPLFAGIYRMGAGLGPATAFLYSGPAINVLAIILTARILGLEIGVARAIGAIVFSVIIGLLMHLIFRKEEAEKANAQINMPDPEAKRPLWQNTIYFLMMVTILVFANWGKPKNYDFQLNDGSAFSATVISPPSEEAIEATYRVKITDSIRNGQEITVAASDIQKQTLTPGIWATLWQTKWLVAGICYGGFMIILFLWFGVKWWKVLLALIPVVILVLISATPTIIFASAVVGLSVITSTDKGESGEWFSSSWGFAKQILPLLFGGVIVAGLLLGRPGGEGLIPSQWISKFVGGNSIMANLFASVIGAFMYFATLTEVPILQGLMNNGMGKGPALALLLAGPALSLPNMLVIRSIMGTKKTIVFVCLVITMSTTAGIVFGTFFG